jgi:rhamnogalacturonyl hydrolase YesR
MMARRDSYMRRSDFIAMVPPFLAYYGMITSNTTVLEEAYTQIKLYRNYLRDPSTGLWRHVVLGEDGQDPGLWATGEFQVC